MRLHDSYNIQIFQHFIVNNKQFYSFLAICQINGNYSYIPIKAFLTVYLRLLLLRNLGHYTTDHREQVVYRRTANQVLLLLAMSALMFSDLVSRNKLLPISLPVVPEFTVNIRCSDAKLPQWHFHHIQRWCEHSAASQGEPTAAIRATLHMPPRAQTWNILCVCVLPPGDW